MALIVAHGDSNVESAGSLVQGTNATFFLKFTDIDGHAYDPFDITVYILDPNDTIIETIAGITKIDVGEYAVDYSIESSATSGVYTLRYVFEIGKSDGTTETRTINDKFVVIQSTSSVSIYANTQRLIMRGYLESLLRATQNIPVKAMPIVWTDRERKVGKFSLGNWNQSAGAVVRRNNNIMTSGYDVDYLRGEIEFDYAMEPTDIIDVDFCCRYLDDSQLDYFMDSGVQFTNLFPPVTNYSVGNTPHYWIYVSMWGAAVDAIRTLILDLIHQQPQIIFGGPEQAQKVVDILDGQKKNYEDQLYKALDMKKYGPYLGLTGFIISPEYTLPGGRCVSAYSTMVYEKSNMGSSASCIYIDSVKNVYEDFMNGSEIKVLSEKTISNETGETILSFEAISKIWQSGKKELLRIHTQSNHYVDVSNEHIMFVGNEQKIASDILVGDLLTINVYTSIIKSPVTRIEKIGEFDTYDIEVPSTQNLFVNGIKCHNSRWFRYLFKSGTG